MNVKLIDFVVKDDVCEWYDKFDDFAYLFLFSITKLENKRLFLLLSKEIIDKYNDNLNVCIIFVFYL